MTRLRVVLIALGCAGSALAQVPPELMDRSPERMAQDAFDGEYGRLLIAEFGRILRESADPACLGSRNIPPAALPDLARGLYEEAVDQDKLLQMGPPDRMPGIEQDLLALCLPRDS